MQVTIHVAGLDRAEERLGKLGSSLHDFSGALAILGAQLMRFYSNDVFHSNGTRLGKRWTPLKKATQDEKDREWRGKGMLVRTEAMQKGFYAENDTNTLFISNKVPYFPYHQLGTSKGKGRGHNIPARPMIGVSAPVEAMIKSVLSADIKAKIEGTNL